MTQPRASSTGGDWDEIRDLWLQKEVVDGRVFVVRVMGEINPADLMTKELGVGDIEMKLGLMNITPSLYHNPPPFIKPDPSPG